MVLAYEQYASGTGPAIAAATGATATGTNFWTLGDHLGSIRDVVDNNGIVRQHVLFDSFGKFLREVDCEFIVGTIASTGGDEQFGIAIHSNGQ